jgi:hypothetical protein
MGTAHPRPLDDDRQDSSAVAESSVDSDLESLREENKQLRELVIQLSKIVIRNVVDRK